jgi:hypothetical protein
MFLILCKRADENNLFILKNLLFGAESKKKSGRMLYVVHTNGKDEYSFFL